MRRHDPTQPKTCPRCSTTQEPSAFFTTRFRTLSSWCKVCTNHRGLFPPKVKRAQGNTITHLAGGITIRKHVIR